MERRAERRAERRTDGRTDGRKDGRTDGRAEEWKDGRAEKKRGAEGPKDGRTEGRKGGRTDGRNLQRRKRSFAEKDTICGCGSHYTPRVAPWRMKGRHGRYINDASLEIKGRE
jgi:hypothetical protein